MTKRIDAVTHFALVESISDEADAVFLDCITKEAAEALKNVSWENIPLNDERFDATILLSVSRDEFFTMLGQRELPTNWVAFHLEEISHSTESPENAIAATLVTLGGSREEDPAVQRFSLTTMRVVRPILKKLSFLVGLESRKNEIKSVLDTAGARSGSQRNVVIYDVGQGNANALVDDWGHPCLFFDFGWPTGLNKTSRPSDPPDFFAADSYWPSMTEGEPSRPPIILSHWDYDHWGYAVANTTYSFGKKAAKLVFKPEALARIWIVPKPPRIKGSKGLGPTHMKLMSSIGTRITWPNTLRSVRFCAGVVTRTNPRVCPSSRNNQSLIWFVTKAKSFSKITLLPGDADFDKIRWPKSGLALNNVVASHHGATVSGINLCSASSKPTLLAVSVGDPNIHGHPNGAAITNYASAGWSPALCTSNRTIWTPASPKQNGAILLKLAPTDPPPYFSCPCTINGNLGTAQ